MTMNKTKVVLLVLLILTVGFIWGQSMTPSLQSCRESEAITTKVIQPIEEEITGKKTISDSRVRKWAHGVEFAVLGMELIWLVAKKEEKLRALPRAFSYGVAIGLLDETIQIFSGRTSRVKDVWIDARGVAIGVLIGFAVLWIVARKAKNKAKEADESEDALET